MLADTNILIYAINIDSPKHKLAQEFIRKNSSNLEFAHQNALEAVRVLTHKRFSNPMSLISALKAVLSILDAGSVISPNETTFYTALELIKKHKLEGNRIFDAYLVATALSNGINMIATDNIRDFKKYEEIKVYNLFRNFNQD